MDGHKYTALFEAPNGKPVLEVYPDPKTKGAPWTVGLGHTGQDVCQGDVWTEDHCLIAFYNDYAVAQGQALHVIGTSTWSRLSEPRQAVLVDMAFNIGGAGLSKFHKMLDAIRAAKWQAAKAEMLDSEYANDVPTRAHKNATVMLTGEWPQ